MTHQTPVHRILLPCLVLLALAGAGCDISADQNGFSITLATGQARDEWSRTYTVAPGGELIVVNVNGGIEVDAGSGPAVKVRAERRARASTDEAARDALKEIEIVEESRRPVSGSRRALRVSVASAATSAIACRCRRD
jgi:hypothetical protein